MKSSKQKIVLGGVIIMLLGGLFYQNCGQVTQPTTSVESKTFTQILQSKKQNKYPANEVLVLEKNNSIPVMKSNTVNDRVILILADGSMVNLKKKK